MTTGTRWRGAADKTLTSLEDAHLLEQSTVVLIGSMARDAARADSDIDLLVVSPERAPRLIIEPDAQIFQITRSEFVDRLTCGDDFPQWAIRYGKVISDYSHWWEEVQRNPALREWPDWRRKLDQARERLRFTSPLLESGDIDHAREELLQSARHLSRGLLLKEHVFPLSQPELPEQLHEIGHSNLAELLDSLIDVAATSSALEEAEQVIVEYVEKPSK